MKIIGTDNFNQDEVSDILVAENVEGEGLKQIVDFLNRLSGEMGPRFYQIKPDDYELYVWEP